MGMKTKRKINISFTYSGEKKRDEIVIEKKKSIFKNIFKIIKDTILHIFW